MKAFFLKTIEKSSLFLGSWPVRFFAWWIATGYFLFYPSRRQSSVRLYQGIFPDRRGWYYLYCAWRQFHSFAATVCMVIPVVVGMTAVIVGAFSVPAVCEAIARHRVTIFPGVPPMFAGLLRAADAVPMDFSSLRICCSGGAPMPV